jgi:diguanylate cyclase (GGDEF)-like protein
LNSNGFLSRNFLLVAASFALMTAALAPVWALGWDGFSLAPWSAYLLILLVWSMFKLLGPARNYPSDDLAFVGALVLTLNLFSNLLGEDRQLLQYMYFLLVALCSLYYSLGFNFTVAGVILALEASNKFLSGMTDKASLVEVALFGAYLFGTALVFGRLFMSEHKKKERMRQAFKRIQDGAASLGHGGDEEAALKSMSPEGRMQSFVESAAELDRVFEDLLNTARATMPADNALIFLSSGGEELTIRVYITDGSITDQTLTVPAQGLVTWVARERKPLLVKELSRGLGYIKDDAGRSFVAAPIMNGGVVEGVIALDSVDADAFDEKDKESLVRFAAMGAHLLRNARAFRNLDSSAKYFAALHKVSSEVSLSLDMQTILEKLAQLTGEIVPYDYLTISFVEAGDKVEFQVLKGFEGIKPPQGPLPLAGSLLAWIVENRQALCLTDLNTRTGNLPLFPAGELKTPTRSFIGIPLISQDAVLGIFTLGMREEGAISAYQQHMLSIIANQVAVSISNARLHNLMQRMATTDGLTGLINHRHFQDKADDEFARVQRFPEPLSIIIFDLDHFKKVNDTYGHPVGDAVLKRVSRILKETVRNVDIAARYGGEEFIALLVNTDDKGAAQMAERIRATVEKSKFVLDGKNIPVTVSIGYATFPRDGAHKKDLIEKADQALYWAKGHGRNQICAFSAIPEHADAPIK